MWEARNKMMRTIWIVFEGIDGSGKTTQAKMLNEYLSGKGIKCIYKHIFDSKAGSILREVFINNEFSNTVDILLLCAARQAFLDEIEREKGTFDIIIMDRFFLSILAMQGKSKEDIELINYIKNFIFNKKDIFYTFYLDTNPHECKRRLIKKSYCDRIERKNVEFHSIVYDRYLDLLENESNVYVFNGDIDIMSLHKKIVDKASELVGLIME